MMNRQRELSVYCDGERCGRYLDLNRMVIKEERLVNDRIGYLFECPFCGKRYPFASLTKHGCEILPELEEARKECQSAVGNEERYPSAYGRYRKLFEQYQREFSGSYYEEEVLKDE